MANEKLLIDAALLLQWVEKLEAYNMGRVSCRNKPKGVTPEGVRHMIDTMPKVDAVEVVHGHWCDRQSLKRIKAGNFPVVKCSQCEVMFCDLINNHHYMYHYCPNCGAKMDGGNEDG